MIKYLKSGAVFTFVFIIPYFTLGRKRCSISNNKYPTFGYGLNLRTEIWLDIESDYWLFIFQIFGVGFLIEYKSKNYCPF